MSEKPTPIEETIPVDIAEIAQAPQPLNLSLYNKVRTALAALHRVDEVKVIRDKAAALEAYSRRARDPELIQSAAEVRLRAERRAGELLKEMAERGERDPGGRGRIKSRAVTQLKNLGIAKWESSRWQKLADLPEPAFEAHVTETRKRLEHSIEIMSAPAPAKSSIRKKAAPAAPPAATATSVSALRGRQQYPALARGANRDA